jgi:cardiolipin synthase (CMP-forming)
VLGHAVVIRPLYISKLNTVTQIVLIGVSLFEGGFGVEIPGLADALIWCVVATTLASGAAYVWAASRID